MDRTLLMADHDLEDIVREAVDKALRPFERKLDVIESKAERTAESVRLDAERALRVATDDRERLARQVRDDSREHAKQVANEVVAQMIKSLGLDPDKPSEFVQDMMFVRDFRLAVKSSKSKALTVAVGIIISAICAGIWLALKNGLKS